MLALHMRDDCAREIHRAQEILLDGFLPLLESSGQKALCRGTAGIGDADIGGAELRYHGIDEALHPFGIGYVERLGEDFGAVLFLNLARRGCEGLRVAGADGDAAAF